ncbi:MAG: hypothetical protein GX039_02210 [Clostridia bacterium]|nr:hypothetical protein [Clostridia bacterium]
MMSSSFWRGFLTGGLLGALIGLLTRRQAVPELEIKTPVTARLTERARGIIQRRST